MLLFPFYAVVIWLLAALWRRQWKGFAAVGLGTGLLLLLEYSLLRLGIPSIGPVHPEQVLVLLVPFTVLVLAVGMYIACLPRTVPAMHCPKCWYDLRGLDPGDLRCPECGSRWRQGASGLEAPTPDGAKPPPPNPTAAPRPK